MTGPRGNHGEDVKEYYFYLDSTPTHSYMKYLYKYPQAAYPYSDLVETNRRRSRQEFEYELLDTGVFDQDRYFDVVVEYAKASPEDLLVQITVANRGPEAATLSVLPTLWFRNVWSWGGGGPRPGLRQAAPGVIAVSHAELGERVLACEGNPALLFTENETNTERLFRSPNRTPYAKDGIDAFVVHGRREAVNPGQTGTKAAAHYALTLSAGMESDADMILRKHNLEALHRLKEANGHAKALLAERPDAKDAYLALGSANYIIGSLSVGFRAMLWFGGVHGDKKLGMQQLEEAADGGRYLVPLAKIMLALAARREKQKALAQKLLRELTEEFPESPLYPGEYAKAMGRPVPASMHP